MSMTPYPFGFPNGLSVRGMPLLQAQPGRVFWVNNCPLLNPQARAGSDNNRGTYLDPFATLNYAVNTACVPGRGDIVFVGAGHKETISDAVTLLMQCSGVAVIGLGAGSQRPTFTFSTANTANVPVAGADMSIQNCLFVGNFLSIASAFTAVVASFTGVVSGNQLTASAVTGTIYVGATIAGTGVTTGTTILSQLSGTTGGAGVYTVSVSGTVASVSMTTSPTDFCLETCEFRDTSGSLGFLSIFTTSATANASDGFTMLKCIWNSQSTVSPTVAITVAANQDRWNILNNFMVSPTTAVTEGPILIAAGANSITNFNCGYNTTQRLGVSTSIPYGIATSGTAWSGHCYYNNFGSGLSGATGIWINTGTKLAFTNNYGMITRAADKSALINPVAV